MKRNYTMNFTNNTLTITKEFEKRAMDVNSPEYSTLKQLRADFPHLRVVKKASPKRRNNISRPSYDKIVKYLSCQSNATILLNEFAEIREYSKAQENPYQFVREWFMRNFPDYQKIPTFDSKGNILAPSANTEKRKVIPMEEQKEVA